MTRFEDRFAQRAAAYAAYRPTYPAALVDFLADATQRHELAWDAGCGSGQLSRLLADRFTRVIATDPSAAQLAHVAPHSRVHYARARAEDSGVASAVADLAVAAQAAHWFDLPAYYAEVRRVARGGALVALVSYGVVVVNDAVDPVVRRFHTEVLGPYWPPERRHVDAGYRSLPFPFPEITAPRLEIQLQWALADLVGYVDTWSAVEALRRAGGDARLAAFRRDLAGAWGAAPTARPVRWPLALRVGRV